MNGTGIKGGAFGFRVSSINKVILLMCFNMHCLTRTTSQSSLIPNLCTILRYCTSWKEPFRSISLIWNSSLKSLLPRRKRTEVSSCVSGLPLGSDILLFSVSLQDVRKQLAELREGLKRIRQELADHYSDIEQSDRYGKQMWTFVGKAVSQLEDLVDDVNHADSTFNEVVKYYGEDERNMSSSEFYGIFKTFVTSYRVRT